MRLSTRSVLAGASTLAIAAGLLTAGAMSASADVSTPAYNDADAYGTLTLYDASGAVKTSGNIDDAPFASYLVGSSAQQGDNPNKRAALFGCAVDPAVPTPALWNCTGLSGSKVYPNVSAPEPVRSSANPTATVVPTDPSLSDLVAQYPPLAGGLYQLRLKAPAQTTIWQIATIKITGSTWTQVFPAPAAASSTSISADRTSPQAAGTSFDLKATVTPSDAAGSVEFFDTVGGTPTSLGTAAVSGGVATKSVSPAAGDHSYSAKFTPADASVSGSTSSSLPFTIKAPATATTVSLSASNTNPDAGSPVDLTASTGPSGVAGSVEFIDSVSGSLGTVSAPDASGQYVLSTSALASGSHSVTAKFTPSSDTYAISNSAPVAINVKAAACPAGSVCTDDQAFQVTVDAGTIVIATPYTPANPFDLGSMKLSADGKQLSASKAFGSATDPAKGVTVTDTRAGDLPWTASVVSTDFTAGTDSINAQNLGFTGVQPVYAAGNALNAATKPVLTFDNAASATVVGPGAAGTAGLRGTPKKFASAANGAGTVDVVGTMTLNAPTSTPAGTYKATVTFTVL